MNRASLSLRNLIRHDAALICLALVTGAGGAICASRYLANRATAMEASIASRYSPSTVVVAANDLAAGDELSPATLALRSMPREFLPPDAVSSDQAHVLIGGRAAIAIRRGTAIVPAAIRAQAAPSSLSGLLATGERALTLPVDDINSQAGQVQVGDRVDLLFRRAEAGNVLLVPLLQQVQVLAVGRRLQVTDTPAQGVDGDYTTVTLRVSVDDASRILLAEQAGDISIVLRSPSDPEQAVLAVRSSRELLHAAPATERKLPRVELLVGGGGSLTPERSWLQVGGRQASNGEST
jgi:pilus assembly protein CpaB